MSPPPIWNAGAALKSGSRKLEIGRIANRRHPVTAAVSYESHLAVVDIPLLSR